MPSFYNACLLREQNIFYVVDDDSFITTLATSVIGSYGLTVTCNTKEELFKNYKADKPNAVFLDIHLGKENGIEILKEIKAIDSDAYVYMLSGDSTVDNVILCKESGAKGFIGKPFAGKQFTDAIEKCPTITRYAKKQTS